MAASFGKPVSNSIECLEHPETEIKSAMFKTVSAAVIFLIFTTSLFFFYLLLSPPPKSFYHSHYLSDSLSSNASISLHLSTLTRRPHVAGSEANEEAANYVLSIFTSANFRSHVASYNVPLTYPESRSLTLTRPWPENPIVFELNQKIYTDDPSSVVANEVLPTFHAFAKSGKVSGPAVYVNYGRLEDYQTLQKMGVKVTGAVVLAKYGKIFRGDIVRNAYEAGAIGALVYSDRKDFGGKKWFPEEKWLPPTGVQVGTVNNGIGDPTTPGWESIGGCERLTDEEIESGGSVTLIPSLPISGADGETIMTAIGGPVADDEWQGSNDEIIYRVGPGPGIVNLSYTGKKIMSTIQNVIGLIEGEEEPDRFVILGNHRDAWTFGAVDPNSGTAALLEIAQRFGKMQERGWKPRRTIVLCNWDAEEYGLIGSTEWVEENYEMLVSKAVAYLNVDWAVSGAGFHTSATPQLDQLVIKATQQVLDPDNSSQTIYESWSVSYYHNIGRLGGKNSDFAAFLQHAGIPAADVSFGAGSPVYHSMYDDFTWMKKFGDPLFHRHVAVSNVWGLIALWLADEEILPFDYHSYARELKELTEELGDQVKNMEINLSPIFNAIEELEKGATKIEDQIKALEESMSFPLKWRKVNVKARELNDRLMMAERAFTSVDGLFERPWYKHLIYGVAKHNEYGTSTFPGIQDAIEKAKEMNTGKAWRFVQHEVWRVARAIRHAALVLGGELT